MSEIIECNQLSFMEILSVNSSDVKPKKKKPKVLHKKIKNEAEEISPLNSLLPWLFPDEYQEEICRSYKGVKDNECQSYVIWDLESDKSIIQTNLFNIAITDIKSPEFISENTLVEHLEWLIDDPIDDFSFLPCFYTFAVLEQVSNEAIEEISGKDLEVHVSKHEAYDLLGQFLIEQRNNLAFRLRKMEKNSKNIIRADKRCNKEKIHLANLKQGKKNLEILSACISIYF